MKIPRPASSLIALIVLFSFLPAVPGAQPADESSEAPVQFPSFVPSGPRGVQTLPGQGAVYFKDTLAEAVLKLTTSPDFRDDDPSDVNDLGYLYFYFGNYEEATVQFKRALALDPRFPDALVNLAVTAYRVGQRAAARRYLQQAGRSTGREGEIAFNLGLLDYEEGDLDRAAVHLEEAVRLLGGDGEAWANLGCVRYQKGDPEGAYRAFVTARQRGAVSQETSMNIALAAFRTDRLEEGLEAAREAVRLAPKDPQCLHLMGIAHLLLRQYSKASLAFAAAIREDAENASYYNHLGRAQLGLDRQREAEQSFQKAMRLAPRLTGAPWNLADLRLRQGRASEALPLYEKAALSRTAANHPVFRYNHAVACYKTGRRKEARALWEEALRLRPDYVLPVYALALSSLEEGDAKTASLHISRGEAMEKGTPRWIRLRGDLDILRGDVREALRHYRKAVERGEKDPALEKRIRNLEKGVPLPVAAKPVRTDPASPSGLRADVERLLEEGDQGRALGMAKEGAAKWPKDPDSWMILSEAHQAAGEIEAALRSAEKASALRPREARYLERCGRLSFEKGDFAAAGRSYRAATRLPDRSREAFLGLGSSLFKQYRVSEASDVWRDALRFYPDSPELYYNLGRAHHELGQAAQARAHIDKALEMRPGYAEAWTQRAVLDLEAGRLGDARAYLEKSLKKDPRVAETHFNLGNLELREGRFEKALQHYRKGLEIHPDDPEGHYHQGVAYLRRGEWSKARLHLERTLDLDPRHADALYNMGKVLVEENDLGSAMKYFEESLRVKPGQSDAHFGVGLVLYLRGDLRGAEKQLKTSRDAPKAGPEPLLYLGRIHEKRGDAGSAEIAYRQAVRQDAGFAPGHLALGDLLRSRGREAEARAEYETVLRSKDLRLVRQARERMKETP